MRALCSASYEHGVPVNPFGNATFPVCKASISRSIHSGISMRSLVSSCRGSDARAAEFSSLLCSLVTLGPAEKVPQLIKPVIEGLGHARMAWALEACFPSLGLLLLGLINRRSFLTYRTSIQVHHRFSTLRSKLQLARTAVSAVGAYSTVSCSFNLN